MFLRFARMAPRPMMRFVSTKAPVATKAAVESSKMASPKIGLAAQLFPLEKETVSESDVDEWLAAVQALKKGDRAPESPAEVYLNELANPEQFLEEKFEPTSEQIAQQEKYQGQKVPLQQDPVITNFTNLMMRHGKKARAEIQLSKALYMVYLKTRQDPVKVLYETLDRLGPLFHTKVKKTGTAKNKTVPFPLNRRQRNRFAILWILEGSRKRKSPDFSVRLSEEIISAYEGKSSGYEKKLQLHKNAMAHRAYIEL